MAKRLESIYDRSPSPKEVVLEAAITFYDDLKLLAGEGVSVTPEATTFSSTNDLAEQLFPGHTPKQLVEVKRTLKSVECFWQVVTGDREGIRVNQPPAKRLSDESFDDWQAFTHRIHPDAETQEGMIRFLISHDLGKADQVQSLINSPGIKKDHDEIILRAVDQFPGRFSSLDGISPKYHRRILRCMRSPFNFAQYVQGEATAATLLGLIDLDEDEIYTKLSETLFDVAGAAGHAVPVGSATMTEPTYQSFKAARGPVADIRLSQIKIANGSFWRERARYWELPTPKNLTDKAILRQCALFRVELPAQAQEFANYYQNTIRSLAPDECEINEIELNISGMDGIPAIMLTYAPALFAAIDKLGSLDSWDVRMLNKVATLAHTLRRIRMLLEVNNFTADISDIATKAATDQKALYKYNWQIEVDRKENYAVVTTDLRDIQR